MLDAFFDLLFPPRCPFCAALLSSPGLCRKCESSLPWTDGETGLREGPGVFRCAGPLRYEGAVREALLGLKFRGESAAAAPLGALIAQCAAQRFSGEFDTVTWVPVSARRRRSRGYDQAELLAKGACARWGVKPVRLLVKRRDNPPQSGLESAEERRANVRDVYEAAPGASAEGRRVLLIDDICTTGSTLRECCRVLRGHGAAEVLCAAVALTCEQPSGGKE